MTEAANIVIEKVIGLLFGVAKKEISYMWNYTENVKKLKEEAKELTGMMGRVQQQIELANEKGDKLKIGVQEWMNEAGTLISMADDFIKEESAAKKTCFNLQVCVNLGTLHYYGKKATNDTLSLYEHQEKGKVFENNASIPTSAPGITEIYQRKNLEGLDSHKLVFEEIIKSIEDESIQIIGIYGTGGVGKTTLAKEVAATAKNQFADVVFITVSQTVDAEKIKKEMEKAAKRIINGDKILIILDDIWRSIELEELGIPCGADYKNCKILFTSRNKAVYESMSCEEVIHVDPLPEEQAWTLFKRVVGDQRVEDAKFKEIATKVAKECGGLPLLIQAIGKALKNKDINLWERALEQLNEKAPSNILPEISKAYTRLKLSYDFLESDEAKVCFLFCSMFPEDSYISIRCLVYYVVGLQKFKNLKSLMDARNRVLFAVEVLKSSCLLLDVGAISEVKMHDVVRDVALLIASNNDNNFLVEAGKKLKEWQPSSESYTGISLMRNKICKLPEDGLHYPLVDIFLIQDNRLLGIPDKFILSMKRVRALDFTYNNISLLPQSLKQLKRLRMLNLSENKSLHEVSILGELKTLEILLLSNTGIKEIPKEIGELVKLRLLEVRECYGLCYIAPDVISKLRCLEELQIGYYSKEEEDGKYNSLVEIHTLSKLTFLYLHVPRVSVFPKGYHFERLKGFVIIIGGEDRGYGVQLEEYSKHKLILKLDCNYIPHMVHIIKVSQILELDSIQNLYNILSTFSYEDVEEIKSIDVNDCHNLVCLVDSTDEDQWQNFLPPKVLDDGGGELKEYFLFPKLEHLTLRCLDGLKVMWNCPDQYLSLNNLVTLRIFECNKLERLFSVNLACRLVNLQKLDLSECKCLEEVIHEEETGKGETNMVIQETINIVFPRLSKIQLTGLPSLTSFHHGNSIIKFPSLVSVDVYLCPLLKKWGNGTYETPKLESVSDVERPATINDGLAKYKEEYALERIRRHMRILRAAQLFQAAGIEED